MANNNHRRLVEWAWLYGSRCYVGKPRTRPWWKKKCRKTTRLKLNTEYKDKNDNAF